MLIAKCDLCKEEILDRTAQINIGMQFSLSRYELCGRCAEPVARFLKENNLVEKIERGLS